MLFRLFFVSVISQAEQPQSIVSRRYKHFLWLHESLIDLFPGVVIPPLPVKQFAGQSEKSLGWNTVAHDLIATIKFLPNFAIRFNSILVFDLT